MGKQTKLNEIQTQITQEVYTALEAHECQVSNRVEHAYQKHIGIRTRDGEEYTIRISVYSGDIYGLLKGEKNV